MIDDAEEQARAPPRARPRPRPTALVAERLAALGELTDSLIAQAATIRRQSEQLLASLEQDGASAGSSAPASAERRQPRPSSAPTAVARRGSHLSAVDAGRASPPTRRRPSCGRAGARERQPAGARLLATQMAVSGSSREEIAARLRNGFEIEDTAAILDAILGPED